MALTAKGLVKLIEECGELTQVCGKKLAYYHGDTHPDGRGPLSKRMEEEMADVLAAMYVVTVAFDLNWGSIAERRATKIDTFAKWAGDTTKGLEGVDQPRPVPNRPNDLRVQRDGNMWCAVCGENLQEGIAGFGYTIEEALDNFDKEYAAQ